MRQSYPSDISVEQFERIRPILEQARKKTHPPTVDLHHVCCGILYVLKSGCQWRMLPKDFPKWRTCYEYWRKWSEARASGLSLLEEALKNVVGEVSRSLGRKQTTRFLIVDAQSVKHTDTAEEKGFDGGKLSSGIKRHLGVDPNGLPHALAVTTVDVTDRKGAVQALGRHKDNLPDVENVLADSGYTGKPFAVGVQAILGATVEIAKRNGLHKFAVLPQRWVVERAFGWLEKCRRLWKNCARELNPAAI
jgi:transposase